MPGTYTNAYPVKTVVDAYNVAAVTAGPLILKRWVCPMHTARIGAVVANAGGAGGGAGNTVIDVLKNGVSIWTTAGDRPTIATASTGEFSNQPPNVRALQKGDVLDIRVVTIPATTGHTLVAVAVAIEGV